MAVYNQEFKVASQAGQVSYVDITETVKNAVATSGIQSGTVINIRPGFHFRIM